MQSRPEPQDAGVFQRYPAQQRIADEGDYGERGQGNQADGRHGGGILVAMVENGHVPRRFTIVA